MADEIRSQKSESRRQNRRRDLPDRLLDFATVCLRLGARLERTATGRYLSGQLMRSSASAGANYREACGAESKADFLHKLQLVLKETREAEYWLLLIDRSGLIPAGAVEPLLRESDELVRILAKSVITAKSGTR